MAGSIWRHLGSLPYKPALNEKGNILWCHVIFKNVPETHFAIQSVEEIEAIIFLIEFRRLQIIFRHLYISTVFLFGLRE
ncbi:MAG: hypothetical protein ACI8V2_002186 [Candidatus Latescibacterota bacterium]